MVLPPSAAWKLVLAIVLGAAILASAFARAPRREVPGADLRRLVLSALVLYVVGGAASLTRHPFVAALSYAAGILACTVAAWLSRGSGTEPPRGGEPEDEEPPPGGDREPTFDWAAFERQFRVYARRERERERAPSR